jgi:hypothetical protein
MDIGHLFLGHYLVECTTSWTIYSIFGGFLEGAPLEALFYHLMDDLTWSTPQVQGGHPTLGGLIVYIFMHLDGMLELVDMVNHLGRYTWHNHSLFYIV